MYAHVEVLFIAQTWLSAKINIACNQQKAAQVTAQQVLQNLPIKLVLVMHCQQMKQKHIIPMHCSQQGTNYTQTNTSSSTKSLNTIKQPNQPMNCRAVLQQRINIVHDHVNFQTINNNF